MISILIKKRKSDVGEFQGKDHVRTKEEDNHLIPMQKDKIRCLSYSNRKNQLKVD